MFWKSQVEIANSRLKCLKILLFKVLILFFSFRLFASSIECSNIFLSQTGPNSVFNNNELKKYNTPTILTFNFSYKSLEFIQAAYHQLPVPKIIQNILYMHDGNSSQLINEAPDYFLWSKNRNTFMTANPAYTKASSIIKALNAGTIFELKNETNGLALITWFVHSKINHQKRILKNNLTPPIQIIKDLESNGEAYLASILDLQARDLPYLKDLKQMSLGYLKNNFGVVEGIDDIRLVFHFPYAMENSTLHLHARVNKPAHPLELSKSYSIDDVIAYLENGKSIKDLILDRQKELGQFYFSLDIKNILERIPGGVLKEVPNPFLFNTGESHE